MKQKLNNPIRKDGKVIYDCVHFGRYPQFIDHIGEFFSPIQWRVLKVEGNIAFLHADRNLDVYRYHKYSGKVTWESCSLRAWLNYDFINRAFTKKEQSAIIDSPVVFATYEVSKYRTTHDKVFLLSYDEAINPYYGFSSDPNADDKARLRTNTAYVACNFEAMNWEGTPDCWWLRSPSSRVSLEHVAIMSCTGSYYNVLTETFAVAVCPALRLDLTSDAWSYAGTVEIGETEESTEQDESPVIGNYTEGLEIELADIQAVEAMLERKIAYVKANKPYTGNDIKELEAALRVVSDLCYDLNNQA